MNIEEYKNKKIWAVVGSVHNKEKYAYKIFKFMKNKGYDVYPVDPSGEDIDGVKSYKSLSELPVLPEAVDMVINPVRGEKFVDEAKELGIKYIWFQPGAEAPEIIKKAESYDINVIHGKCVMVEF